MSASVCSALLLEIEAAQGQQTPEACMRHVVSHALQAALGEACHPGALHRKLQVTHTQIPATPTRHSLSSSGFPFSLSKNYELIISVSWERLG